MTRKDDELIRKATNGRMSMYKSHFDFREKPESTVIEEERKSQPRFTAIIDVDRRGKQVSTKGQINQMFASQQRTLRQLKTNTLQTNCA